MTHLSSSGPGVAQTVLLFGRSRDRIPVVSVTGIFLVDTNRTMSPGGNSASKKWVPGIPLGVKAAGAWGWRPTTPVVPNVKKSGALTYPDPLGHLDGLLWERPLPYLIFCRSLFQFLPLCPVIRTGLSWLPKCRYSTKKLAKIPFFDFFKIHHPVINLPFEAACLWLSHLARPEINCK